MIVGEELLVDVIAHDRRYAGTSQHRGREAHRVAYQREWRRALIVDVRAHQRSQTRNDFLSGRFPGGSGLGRDVVGDVAGPRAVDADDTRLDPRAERGIDAVDQHRARGVKGRSIAIVGRRSTVHLVSMWHATTIRCDEDAMR